MYAGLRNIAWIQFMSAVDTKKSKVKTMDDLWPIGTPGGRKVRKTKTVQKRLPLWLDHERLKELDKRFNSHRLNAGTKIKR